MLECRTVPASLDIQAGALSFTDTASEANAVTVATDGTTYTIADTGAPITLTANATAAGWTLTNPNTAQGPEGSVISLAVNAGGGDDSIAVRSLDQPLAIDTGGGTGNAVQVGGTTGLGAQAINAPISIQSTGGKTSLTVDDSENTNPVSAIVDDGAIRDLAPADITFTAGDLSSLTVDGGGQGNTFIVAATPAGIATMLNSGLGDDQVQVLASTGALAINGIDGHDSVTIGDSGVTQGVAGNVAISNVDGRTDLTVDDSADSSGRSITVRSTHSSPSPVTTGSIVGFMAPGATISWTAGQLSSLDLNTGSGNDTASITPDESTPISFNAGGSTPGGGSPGNALNLDLTGVNNPVVLPASGVPSGQATAANRQAVAWTGVDAFTTSRLSPVLVGYSQFAVGPDAGGGPIAATYNPDGSLSSSKQVFDPSVTGGVRTAVADFNGDGVNDLAVGIGVGSPDFVEVVDGKTGNVLFQVAPFGGLFTGGVFVAAGDITGDGKAELIVTPDQGGGPRVEIYRGGDFTLLENFFGIADPGFRGGARAAAGDLNGDGFADLVVSAGFAGGPRVSVYDGAALAAGNFIHPVNDFFLFDPSLRNGAYVAVGDVNGDGMADIIGGAGPGGGPRVLVVSGATLLSQGAVAAVDTPLANFFAGDPNNRGGVRVAAKNLDGDVFADIVVGDGQGAGSRVTSYLSKNFSGGTAPQDFAFDAFPGLTSGVFVG
ncbi:MAG TPA: VCBS repeat-containing protein [Urbifossiella sp.]|nr:VCBS repeat-containing protein [Urbifossiella sp.]